MEQSPLAAFLPVLPAAESDEEEDQGPHDHDSWRCESPVVRVDLLNQCVDLLQEDVSIELSGDLSPELFDGVHDDLILGLLKEFAQCQAIWNEPPCPRFHWP